MGSDIVVSCSFLKRGCVGRSQATTGVIQQWTEWGHLPANPGAVPPLPALYIFPVYTVWIQYSVPGPCSLLWTSGGCAQGHAGRHVWRNTQRRRGVHTCGDVTRPHLPEGAEGRGIWEAGAARICGPTNEPFSRRSGPLINMQGLPEGEARSWTAASPGRLEKPLSQLERKSPCATGRPL